MTLFRRLLHLSATCTEVTVISHCPALVAYLQQLAFSYKIECKVEIFTKKSGDNTTAPGVSLGQANGTRDYRS